MGHFQKVMTCSKIPAKGRKIQFSNILQGGQDHFFPKEMLISSSILKLLKNP